MKYDRYQDEEILKTQMKQGDENAYEFLYRTYYAELCSYMFTIGGNDVMAEEIAQQTFIKLWRRRDKLFIHGNLKRYIFKVAYHQYIDVVRKKKKEHQLLEELKYEAIIELLESNPDGLNEKIGILETEINKLPVQCRNVFLLSKKDGLKYKEIAEQLDISIKTVERHMAKALKRLRDRFDTTTDPSPAILFLAIHREVFKE